MSSDDPSLVDSDTLMLSVGRDVETAYHYLLQARAALADLQRRRASGPQSRPSRDRDIILQAINEYDAWMKDDDYDVRGCLDRIIGRMRERAALTPDK